jgi:AcrR family transcriptional regulator
MNSIVKAGVQYILKHGLKDVTLRNLSTGIDTSARMLVHYFGNSLSLFDQICAEFMSQEKARATKLADAAILNPEPLRFFALGYLDALVRPRSLGLVNTIFEIYGTSIAGNKTAKKNLNELCEHWLLEVDRVIQEESLPSSREMQTMVMAFMNGTVFDLIATGDRGRVIASVDVFVASLLIQTVI